MKKFITKLTTYLILGAAMYLMLSLFNWEINALKWDAFSIVFYIFTALCGLVLFENDKIF